MTAILESKSSVLEHRFMKKKIRGSTQTHTHILYAFGFLLDFSQNETLLFIYVFISIPFYQNTQCKYFIISQRSHSSRGLGMSIKINYLDLI